MARERFERYVVIDWSAAASPTTGADSIWIAVGGRTGSIELANPSTRLAAGDIIDEIVAGDDRVIIGVDVCLGYPAGSAALFGLNGVPWLETWRAIAALASDDRRNANNRFDVAAAMNGRAGDQPGPFWGCPNDDRAPALQRTKPATFPIGEFRAVEVRLRALGRQPKSPWQLLGAGSVGGQALTMLPFLHERIDRLDVWPFTTGLGAPSQARVVVAEIWPSWFVREIPAGMVRDAAQVSGTIDALRTADASGEMAGWFCPGVDHTEEIAAEEGWILGIG